MLHILMGIALANDTTKIATASESVAFQPIMLDWYESHGPEKPPPDDGYEFKGANGGNALGKLGLLAMGSGLVTSVMYLKAEDNSDRKRNLGYSTGGLFFGGVLCLVIERAT